MFALIEASGKHYPVQEGSVIQLDSYKGNLKDEVVFERVLFIRNKNQVVVGRHYVDGAKVKGIVLRHGQYNKVVDFKYKQKVKYRRITGHRKPMTLIKIQSIES